MMDFIERAERLIGLFVRLLAARERIRAQLH
jgi:hypothetical protein